jgi:hypothetical protein
MTQERHFDVAAYALGILDERDAARFEEHLIDCPMCAVELESLLPVVDVLADVDPDSLIVSEQSRDDGVVLHRMIGAVNSERRKARTRRMFSLAAALVVFAMLSIGGYFLSASWYAPSRQIAAGPTPSGPSVLDPLPADPGVGGPELRGERFGATDPRTNVRADVALEAKDWGTQVSFLVANVRGPLTCRLVAVRTNGQQEVLSTWTVGEKGWGTSANPRPLMLQAVTALPRSEIAHLQVQAMSPNGSTETLVRVP